MNCKDCIHYEVCKNFSDLGLGTLNEDECGIFKDKACFVKPPCNVGDTVYFETYNGFGNSIGIMPHKVEKVLGVARIYGKFSIVDIPFSEFGKTVFLTKEEAEKKLKEKRK